MLMRQFVRAHMNFCMDDYFACSNRESSFFDRLE